MHVHARQHCHLPAHTTDERPPTIIVSTAEPIFAQLMQDIMPEFGFGQVICPRSNQAYATICEQQPDVVLLDLNVHRPAESLHLLQQLCSHNTTASIPVLICSTNVQLASAYHDIQQMDYCQFIEKPFQLTDLEALLAEMVARYTYEHTTIRGTNSLAAPASTRT